MKNLQVDGASLAWDESGVGEPVVLVHGSASDHRTWAHLVEPLSKQHRVVRYSRRYHWPNDPIPSGVEYTMEEQVRDLEAVLREVDAVPAHLVGHSYGAFLCLLVALRKPGLVRSMVLAEPPVLTLFVSNTPGPMEILRLLLTRPRMALAIADFGFRGLLPARKAFAAGDVETGIRKFGKAVFGGEGYEGLGGVRKTQVRDNLSNVGAELLGPGFSPLHADQVRSLEVPTLLVAGEKSTSFFRRLADGLEELLPVVDQSEVPAASHAMHEDNPPFFNRLVQSFLQRHRHGAAGG